MVDFILFAIGYLGGFVTAWAFRGLIQRKKDELKTAAETEAKTLADRIRGQ